MNTFTFAQTFRRLLAVALVPVLAGVLMSTVNLSTTVYAQEKEAQWTSESSRTEVKSESETPEPVSEPDPEPEPAQEPEPTPEPVEPVTAPEPQPTAVPEPTPQPLVAPVVSGGGGPGTDRGGAASAPTCTLRADGGDILIDFTDVLPDDFRLIANGSGEEMRTPKYHQTIPSGTYKVTLQSYDNHSEQDGENQQLEKWQLRFFNPMVDREIFRTSSASRDIPDNVDTVTSVVDTNLFIDTDATYVRGIHAAYQSSGSESVMPVCALIEPVQTTPQGCDTPRADITVTQQLRVINAGRQMTATVRNNSNTCTYQVGIGSYELLALPVDPLQQRLFDTDTPAIKTLAPGQTTTLTVDVPGCGYQVDLFAGPNVPQIPDFENAPLGPQAHRGSEGTHTLLDYKVASAGGVCGSTPQCPLDAPQVQQLIERTGVVGQQFTAAIPLLRGDEPITWRLLDPQQLQQAGLSFNAQTRVLSGVLRQAGIFQGTIEARNQCGFDTVVFRVRVTDEQCPLAPPAIRTEGTHQGFVGQQFSHNITVTGGQPITVRAENLPAGLSLVPVTSFGQAVSGAFGFSAENNEKDADTALPTDTANYRITGVPQPGTEGTHTVRIIATNECLRDETTIVITIGGGDCPLEVPVITSDPIIVGTVGQQVQYELTATGGEPITFELIDGTLPDGLEFVHHNENAKRESYEIVGVPTEEVDTTVVVRARNECGFDDIVIRIKVTTTNECPLEPAVITSSTNVSAQLNQEFRYEVTYTGEEPVEIAFSNLPGWLATTSETELVGTPTQVGTYTLDITATNNPSDNQCNDAIQLTINVNDVRCTNCGGGGGGPRRPNVVLFSSSTQPEVLGSFISLAQVPYTGLGSSIFQIILFIVGLLAISGGVAYTILRRRNNGSIAASVIHEKGSVQRETPFVQTAQAVPAREVASYEAEYAATADGLSEPFFASPVVAQKNTHTEHTETPVAIDQTVQHAVPVNLPTDNSKGASAAESKSIVDTQVSEQKHSTNEVAVQKVSLPHLIENAKSARALVSEDGMKLVALAGDGRQEKAEQQLMHVLEIAKTRFPREDGWLVLDKERVRESLFISILSTVPIFIEWIVRGEDKKVFTFLRMMKAQEQPVADFIRKVVAEIDNAHRARLEGALEQAHVDPHVAEVTYHLSNKELETMIGVLLEGVDERYESPYTSVRLSLVRVLDTIRERSLTKTKKEYSFTE